jgi:hypothetical protein
MTQVAVSLISTFGVLLGVGLGAVLTARAQLTAWRRQEEDRSRQERRKTYASFLAAAREWRATVMSPDARIVEASMTSRVRHASGEEAGVAAMRTRAEVALIVADEETLTATDDLVSAVRRIAEARGRYEAGKVPEPIVQQCREAERRFLVAARRELGSAALRAAKYQLPSAPR